MAIDYEVAVKMMLTGGIENALIGVSRMFTTMERQVGGINAGFLEWGNVLKAAALTGGLFLFAKVVGDILEDTKKLNGLLTELKTMGAGPQEMAKLHEQAMAVIPNMPGMTEATYTGIYSSIRDMFKGTKPKELEEIMPELAKFQQIMINERLLHGKSADLGENDLRSVVRSGEIMGQFSDKEGNLDLPKFRKFLDFAEKSYIGTHGQFGPSELLNMGKTGGISLSNMDEDSLYAAMVLAQQMGGYRAGTAEMSLLQQFGGGTMRPRSAQALKELGILKEGDYTESKGGGIKPTPQGQERLHDFIGTGDPIKIAEAFKEAMVAAGITDTNKQVLKLFEVLSRATTQRYIGEALRNDPALKGEIETIKQGQGINDAYKTQQESIAVAQNNVAKAMTNLYTSIGEGHALEISSGLNRLAADIQLLANASNALGKNDMDGFYRSLSNLMSVDAGSLKAVIEVLDKIAEFLRTAGNLGAKLHEMFKSGGGSLPGESPTAPGAPGYMPMNFIVPEKPPGSDQFKSADGFKVIAVPPSKPDVQRNVTTINLDGTQLAKFVDERIALLQELPDSASAANGVAAYNKDDWNTKSV